MTELYIAYGSNLNKRQMRVRCQYARPLGKFMLTDARLVFRGVLDVEYWPGEKVPCALWSVNKSDIAALDRYEGVSGGLYYKERGIVIKYLGKPRNTLMYLMRSEGIFPPSQQYVNTIRKGYKDFGLDKTKLNEAIARSFLSKSPDAQTRSRRQRQKQSNLSLVAKPEIPDVSLSQGEAR